MTEPSHAGRRLLASPLAWGVAAAIAALAIFDSPLFRGHLYMVQDLANFYVPVKWFYQQALQTGESFDWLPHWYLGYYLQGEDQAGFDHPLTLLLYRTLPLDAALHVELLRSYALLLVGTFLLLRRWALTREAALFGGVVAALGGAAQHHFFMLNVMAGLAHVPFLLLLIDVVARTESPRVRIWSTLGLALGIASQLVLGHPQTVYIGGLFGLGYLALLWRAGSSARRLPRICAAAVLGVVIASGQMLPMLDALSQSTRAGGAIGPSDAAAFHPLDTVQLALPFVFDRGAMASSRAAAQGYRADLALYSGALTLPLVLWLLGSRDPRTRGYAAYAGALAGLFVLLSFGHAGGLYAIQAELPLVGGFRTPARYGLGVGLAMALLLAVALDRAIRAGADARAAPRASGRWLAAAPLTALVGLGVVMAMETPRLVGAPWLVFGVASVGGAAALVYAIARGSRAALAALFVFAAADLTIFAQRYLSTQPSASIDAFVAALPVPPDYDPELRLLFGHPALLMRDVKLAIGGGALIPASLSVLSAGAGEAKEAAEPFARIASIGWRTGRAPARELDPLPRARLVGAEHVSADPIGALAEIDVETTASVESALGLEAGPAGAARILSDRPGAIEVEVDTERRQLLVVSEGHHPGWRAVVDGEERPAVRVYGAVIGAVVGPGRSVVRFAFAPESLALGNALGLAGLLALVVWSVVEATLWRRLARPGSGAG